MSEDEDVGELEKWSEKHFGELAFWRTIVGFANLLVGVIIMTKIFGWI